MMKRIESQELKTVQYNILLYVKEVCEKHNINYIIGYGTLLGAIRHKGFIPWDDDIDVMLLRKDYEKFAKAMEEEKHQYYRFCNMVDGSRCHGPYGIMEDTRTAIFHDRFNSELLKDEGVSVDIFPFDDVPDDEEELRKILKTQKMWKALNNLRITEKYPKTDSGLKILLKKMGKLVVNVIGTKRIFENTQKIAHKKFEKECTRAGDLMCDPEVRNCFEKKFFLDTIDVLFEKDYFKAPKSYDEYLKHCYGDYMQLPPIEQRQGVHEYEYYWR